MKRLNKIALAFAAATSFCAPQVWADNIAITGGTAFTMGEQGKVENATILIEGDVIKSVKSGGSVPSGYKTIDAKGKWVTPGIIGAYTSLGLVEVEYSAGISDYTAKLEDSDYLGTQIETKYAVNPDSSLMNLTRIEGVTSAISVMADTDTLFQGQGAFISLGDKVNPIVKGNAVMTLDLTGSKVDDSVGSRAVVWPKLVSVLEEAASLKGKTLRKKDDWDGDLSKADVNALVPVMKGDMPLLITVNRTIDIRHVVHLKQKFEDLNIVLVQATEAWRVADELAAHDIAVLLKPESNLPYDFDELGATLSNAARLDAAGVKVVIGMDTHNARLVLQHAGNAVAHGLPWEKGLASITSVAAEALGVSASHGSMEKGKSADVVVWSGDPLEVMSYAETVVIDGEEIPMTSRPSKLRDRYLKMQSDKAYRYVKP
ncbi:amidohydrolase family protein [Planctobacterium marinum]|uniref:Amidohydrolase n=1 Tax=Planctobacterium marinum TaxID=1631968 RepID=A0AA48KU66_9ALTE|nr:amidohydrolase [Planctobacterium marinum]